jgi:hypothetical protein
MMKKVLHVIHVHKVSPTNGNIDYSTNVNSDFYFILSKAMIFFLSHKAVDNTGNTVVSYIALA